MRATISVMLACALSGCFFFWIPMKGADPGNTCLEEKAYIGQRIKHTTESKTGAVKSIFGRSSRCQDSAYPILGTVEYE